MASESPTSVRSRVEGLRPAVSSGKASASRTARGAVWWLTPTTTITEPRPPPPGTSVAQAKVKTTTRKPAMPSQAARRPPHPARWRATMSTT